ncbi:AbrB/MazE/SpoVT family DNA-binding domain-containing protein [Lactiplantibacillus fabifermentans]|uniref:SpoVT-AbrB domain-containing protein n=2 Tax=Lactiplantibacillus fabifermentans TaxID=483011 RepID=A0A0R2NUT0_9LACO|nr:AbrB/MazE/SpoVT family DNA-binding domain-containing protein [Lactiplantibacillus fabifermentans]ETY75062.1 AbrB family transcriptional regulator [Lactiplantibacillus fabifermentans T30PCM01]KRO29471.1 hypothetical protein DY78_GL000015 [Lactiplantibacillus fabifermentans DSM 21115]
MTTENKTYTATVSTRGRITIPIELRRELGLVPGDIVNLIQHTDGTITLKKPADDNVSELPKVFNEETVYFNDDGTVDEKRSPNFAAWMHEDSDEYNY